MNEILKIESLSSRFRSYLKYKGYISVAEFARDCKLHPQSIFRHIRGEHNPDIKRLFLYANVLGASISEILEVFYPDEMSKNRLTKKTA